MFESPQDSLFRDQVNDLYEEVIVRNQETDYYIKMIQCGIDQKFGSWPLGYDILPEYFEYGCVIFPESTWTNDEVAITEKILKCCFAGSLPWPVGGSNINKMYKDLGFYTAWNLLPEEHQKFDQEKDHMLRYQGLAAATAWLSANKEVLVDDRAKGMLQSNLINMLTCSLDVQAVQKFDKLITQYLQK